MRIPIPQRFAPRSIAIFAAIIFVGQQMQGTDFFFSVGVAAFIWIWGAAFNAAGGIEYTSGAFILFNGLFTVIVGMVAKLFLWQAGNGNLRNPRSSILCYCIGMGGMWLAAVFTRNLRRHSPLLKDFSSLEAMKQASIVSLIITILFQFVIRNGQQGGGITGIFFQLDLFPFLAILLAVTYEVRRTNGERSINWVGGCAIAFMTAFGLASFSKEGMLIGGTAWVFAAALNRFNFTWGQLIGSALGFFLLVYYLVPYSQYVRLYRTGNASQDAAIALKYLADLNQTRHLYETSLLDYDLTEEQHLFNQRVPFLDRLVIFAPDDALIANTNKGNVFGLTPTLAYNLNVIPHIIWKNKPDTNFGNLYAHDLGMVAYEDFTTGISFSPTAEFYHEAKWLGLLLVMPLEMFLGFLVIDSLVGSTRQTPWATLWILLVSHSASEAGASGPVGMYTGGVIAMLFCYWTLTRVAPSFLSVMKGNKGEISSAMAVPEST